MPVADANREIFERETQAQLDTLYRFAVLLAHDPIHAEDLVQDTMLKAYRSWHQYRLGSNMRAWLLTILRNTFINDYRKALPGGRLADVTEMERYTIFEDVQPADPEDQFFEQIIDEDILAAIDALPLGFRETLLLNAMESLSYGEIAKITKVSIGTVKSRLCRARRALRSQLDGYGVERGYVK